MRTWFSTFFILLTVLAGSAHAAGVAGAGPRLPAMASLIELAQASTTQTTIDGNRRCQTIRTCRFRRGGSFRGCISTYTCRACRMVRTRCDIGGRRQNCHEMQCTWGG